MGFNLAAVKAGYLAGGALPSHKRRTDLKNGRAWREKPPPAPNKQQGKTPERRPRTRFKARASKPSSRERPNRRREVHYNSAAEATATLTAAETATLKQAEQERQRQRSRERGTQRRAPSGAGARRARGGASRAKRASSAEQRERITEQTKKAAGAAFLIVF